MGKPGQENQPSRAQNCAKLCYNSADGTIMTRTPKSWRKFLRFLTGHQTVLIFLFYVVFFCLLAGMFIGMLYIFLFFNMDRAHPRLIGSQSILRGSPGIGIKPSNFVGSTLKISKLDGKLKDDYLKEAKAIIDSYAGTEQCSKTFDIYDKGCAFDTNKLGSCVNPEQALSSGRPCTYLSLNRIYGWLPNTSDNTTSIKVHCTAVDEEDRKPVNLKMMPKEGENGIIDSLYFPFVKQKGYVSPLIALQFSDLKVNSTFELTCQTTNLVVEDSETLRVKLEFHA